MKTFATFAAALTAVAGFAMAAPREQRSYSPCSGLYSTAQCCAVNVLGIADLDCANPPETPTSPDDFQKICASVGQEARCCVLPILEQDVLCERPAGVEA